MNIHRRRYWALLLSGALIIAVFAANTDSGFKASAASFGEDPVECLVTLPPDPAFVPPEPYPAESPYETQFWYGTEEFWTLLPKNGTWEDLPFYDGHYAQKSFWWTPGYDYRKEPTPEFTLIAERIDGEAARADLHEATNAYHADFGSTILMGVSIPSTGCWQLTGFYEGMELSFVVLVRP